MKMSAEDKSVSKRGLWAGGSKCCLTTSSRVQTWLNVVVVMALQIPRSTSYAIVLPSLYQFVTAPSNDNEYGNGTQDMPLEPGLGESEQFYSWTVTIFSLAAFVVSPLAGVLPRIITYRFSILIILIFYASGALLYALTEHGWMLILARFLLGIFDGASPILLLSFASESASTLMARNKDKMELGSEKGKRRYSLKDKLLTADLMAKLFIFPLSYAISTVMAQFPKVDQYRWPGWFLFALGVTYAVIFLLVYRQKESTWLERVWCKRGGKKTRRKDDKSKCHFLSKRAKCENLIVICYLVYCGYVIFTLFNISDTLLPPVLSDMFGFNISENSVFFMSLMFVSLGAGGILIFLKCLRTDNRIVLIIALSLGITGLTLCSDWQSIGQDPCYTDYLANSSSLAYDEDLICADARAQSLSSLCTVSNGCMWNCRSRVTGQPCQNCPALCRSDQKSIHFVQFSIGIVLIVVCLQVCATVIIAIATDVIPIPLQGVAISAIYGANSVARTVTPLWISYIYSALGRHTYPPLSIINATLLGALLGVVCLYRRLGHRKESQGVTNPVALELAEEEKVEV